MIFKLTRGLTVDTDDIPEDFEAQIQKCFSEYTYGTAKEYTFEDKLRFIDLCVEAFHGNLDEDDAVMYLVKSSMEADLNEGSFPQEDDYFSFEYMAYCYKEGRDSQRLQFGSYMYNDRHLREDVEKLLIRIIETVISWSRSESKLVPDKCPYCSKALRMHKNNEYAFCPYCGCALIAGRRSDIKE